MSVYRRFVSYMFRYEKGVKKDNVGYAKIENYNGECRINVHIKDSVKREQKASVYLFYRDGDKMQGIFMKEMSIVDGVGDCKITTESKNIGGLNCNFETIGGIIVYITANRFWGTEWDDKPISGFSMEKEEVNKTDNEIELKAAVLEQAEELNYIQEMPDMEADCFSGYTKLYPFYKQDMECIGITPKELCEVSPVLKEWGDNSFVQYGYGRFQHILMLREREKEQSYFIGVPGMYRPSEEKMAVTYGFERFIPVRKECVEYGDFGYWCKKVLLDNSCTLNTQE